MPGNNQALGWRPAGQVRPGDRGQYATCRGNILINWTWDNSDGNINRTLNPLPTCNSGVDQMRYKLQILDRAGNKVTSEWILQLPAVVGRSPDADVPIGDASISRRHFQFYLNGEGALSVRDFDSMNGTYIDDKRINRSTLMPGDVVRIGAVSMKLEWTEDPVTERPRIGKASSETTQPLPTIPRKEKK